MATTIDTGPNLVIIAGPNGSGKSTSAPQLLRDYFGVVEFVNADVIAQGLSAFDVESAALDAGRIMIERLDELRTRRSNCAFETTLAARSIASWVPSWREDGYRSHLVYYWLPSPDIAVARVATRVREGGHGIPEDVIRRRYQRGLKNLVQLYLSIVDTWKVFDGMSQGPPALIAEGHGRLESVLDVAAWRQILEAANE